MTIKERLDWLCRLRSEIYVFMPKEWLKPMDEALTDSIKALEEPCGDCCNGNQIEKAKLCQKSYIAGMEHKQEPKTGHWIEKDGFDGDVYYDCSECGESWTTIEGTPWDNEWKYCPNCGAKMESEN